MSISKDPIYQKGFRAGRRRTEQEVASTMRKNTWSDEWNRVYIALLPAAMDAQNWTMTLNGVKVNVTNSDQRVELCRRWTDEAMKNRLSGITC